VAANVVDAVKAAPNIVSFRNLFINFLLPPDRNRHLVLSRLLSVTSKYSTNGGFKQGEKRPKGA
jgi:hypothetical protein